MVLKDIRHDTYTPTPQGMEILQAVCEYGGLTPLQLTILLNYKLRTHDEGRLLADRYCTDLVKQLRESEYLEIVPRGFTDKTGRQAYVHRLTSTGRRALAFHRGCKVSQLGCAPVDVDKLEHFVLMTDFRVTLLRAMADTMPGAELHASFDERTLAQMHSHDKMTIVIPPSPPRWPHERLEHDVRILPDYFFLMVDPNRKPSHYRRFVEIDRSTETVKTSKDYDDWFKKILKYREYRRRIGDQRSLCEKRYDNNSVVVLSVTTSDKRMQNLKEVTEKAILGAGAKLTAAQRFWFTTFDRLTPSSFFHEPIWAIGGKEGMHAFIATGNEDE